MPAMEKRYPRTSFDKKLAKICAKLDESSERVVEYKDFYDESQSSLIKISTLWVVGSFARGAVECGDLDLVIQISATKGRVPLPRTVTKAFFGVLPLVRYYSGTPEDNTSGVPFPDAVEIWSGKGCDWKKSIASIAINPDAGRTARETDCIPLRNEQMRIYEGEMQSVAALIKDGSLESEFVPFGQQMLKPLVDSELGEARRRKFLTLGRKSREMLPALIRLMDSQEPYGEWSRQESTKFQCGGTVLHLGRPPLDVRCFEKALCIRQLALIPHLSARGPNGAWLIRRGPKDKDVASLSNRYAFTSCIDGAPELLYSSYDGWSEVRILELDRSKEDARQRQATWADIEKEPAEVVEVRGAKLLEFICSVDIIEMGEEQFAVTWAGRIYLERMSDSEHTIASLPEIIAVLPTLPRV